MVPRPTTVKEIMTPDPFTLSPAATVGQAHDLMKAKGFRHLPVVAMDSLVGVVTMTDIGHFGAGLPEIRALIVGDVMTKNPFTIEPSERIEVAAGQMALRKVHCLLVVAGGRLVGIVTTYDLLDALAKSLLLDDLARSLRG